MALATRLIDVRVAIAGLVTAMVLLPSCLFVKAPEKKPSPVDHAELSPLPEVEMGEELVRTAQGDMISLLPKGWVFLEPDNTSSDDILVVAVNPDYTLTAVFSGITASASSNDIITSDGLLGLARVAYGLHNRKSGGVVKLVDSYAIDTLGTRQFGTYSFSPNGAVRTRCAVFTSTLGNHYEFALVPLLVTGRELPTDREQEQIFNSILATVQY